MFSPHGAEQTLVPRKYSSRDIKLLFALSRNQCAFPGCANPIVADATGVDEAAVVGQIAHIVASRSSGPRGDPAVAPEELDREANLILLCGHHHALVDAQASTYTADQLRQWKRAHVRAPRGIAAGAVEKLPIPDQVPAAPRAFVDRERDLARLDLLAGPRSGDDGPAIVLVGGAHGIGKTAISRVWSHRNSSRFPDGRLYADLGELRHHGAVAVRDVLGGFLSALGTPQEMIPAGPKQREALFRSRTAGKRLLVVLDDPEYPAEVTPLLPNGRHSVVLVAGRAALEELVLDRARPLTLGRLNHVDAAKLLAAMIGEDRVVGAEAAIGDLVQMCDGLPIALRICGARLELERDRTVSWLVVELADERSRLRRLALGSSESLDAVFSTAYRALSEAQALLYRRLGGLPVRSVTSAVAAAAAGLPGGHAHAELDALARAHLIEASAGRYRFHDLLRIHARGRAEQEEPPEAVEAAVRSVICFYIRACHVIDTSITRQRLRVTAPPSGTVAGLPQPSSSEQAFAWFEAERSNILEILRAAARRELHGAVCAIAESLWPCYFNRKPYSDWIEAYDLAAAAARHAGMPEAEARLRSLLGKGLSEIGDHEQAEHELAVAGRLAVQAGNALVHASVLEFQGHLAFARGAFDDALAAYEHAREMFIEQAVARGVALQHYHVGRTLSALNQPAGALAAYRAAEALIDSERDELLLGRVMIDLAQASLECDQRIVAEQALARGLAIARRHGLRYYEARALEVQALLAADRDEHETARDAWRQAHAIYEGLSSPRADALSSRIAEP